MRELILRIPLAATEEVLDRLLPIVPDGVRELPAGEMMELRMRGTSLPSAAEVARTAGRCRYQLSEHEVSDDWRERRLADYRPAVIAERLVVRPDWAPPAAAGLIDIALAESSAFGVGRHPTTRACLELMLGLTPSGSFADLGCGTGVLAILAAKLGYAPVHALDVKPDSVAATGRNAAANGVALDARVADLSAEAPPDAGTLAANVGVELHERIAAALHRSTDVALLSGFGPADAAAVLTAYAPHGLTERRRVERDGWLVLELARR